MAGGRAEQMKLVKQLRKQGFEVERTGSGHWNVTKDGQHVTYMSFSPKVAGLHPKMRKLLMDWGFKP